MKTLTPSERRALRAKAHHLDPVVSIGQHGLTESVMKEIEISLRAHELMKIRMFGDDRAAREAALQRICTELDAAPVQHLGKLLIIWRPAPPEETAARSDQKGKPSTTKQSVRKPRPTVVSTRKSPDSAPKAGARTTARKPRAGPRSTADDAAKHPPVALQRRRRATAR